MYVQWVIEVKSLILHRKQNVLSKEDLQDICFSNI